MDATIVHFPTEHITGWDSFHAVSSAVFGFPPFYGRNMNAWIDCMTFLDEPNAAGMATIRVATGGVVIIKVDAAVDFKKRCPEQYAALIECAAFVNYRRKEDGQPPILALMLIGHF